MPVGHILNSLDVGVNQFSCFLPYFFPRDEASKETGKLPKKERGKEGNFLGNFPGSQLL
jgi:hypothetical protein